MASYYFQRGAEKVGPFNVEEMTEFLRDGRLGYTDPVMREGEDEWRTAQSIPELGVGARTPLVARGVASQAPARAWTAGQPPTRPGIFLRFAHPLPELTTLIESAGARWAAVETGRSRLRWSLVAPLLALMFLLAWIDRQVGFDVSVFGTLVPFCLAGALLVLLATRQGKGLTLRGSWEAFRQHGCAAAVLVPFGLLGGLIVLGLLLRAPLVAAILAAVAVLIVRWRRKSASAPESPLWRTRLSAVSSALDALRDDAAPLKPASGWLDLTGAEQPHKLLSRGRAQSGASSEVFRDDWWSLALPLRDGNRLRITASDRLKLKRGRWRRGSRKTKWKAGSERTLSSVDLRLRVNPAVYRIVAEPPMPYVTISGDTLSTAFDARGGLETKDLLRSLSLLYKRLEPLQAQASGG